MRTEAVTWSARRSRPIATLLAALGLAAGLFAGPAAACDSCNDALMYELLHERSDTAMARDVLAAVENQRRLLPLLAPAVTRTGEVRQPVQGRRVQPDHQAR